MKCHIFNSQFAKPLYYKSAFVTCYNSEVLCWSFNLKMFHQAHSSGSKNLLAKSTTIKVHETSHLLLASLWKIHIIRNYLLLPPIYCNNLVEALIERCFTKRTVREQAAVGFVRGIIPHGNSTSDSSDPLDYPICCLLCQSPFSYCLLLRKVIALGVDSILNI